MMQCVGNVAKNLAQLGPKLPAGAVQFVKDANDVQRVKLARDEGREKREPLAQDTWASVPWRYSPHEANAFVDTQLHKSVTREDFRKYRQFRKDALAATPLLLPLLFGPTIGLPLAAVPFANEHNLPTSFTRRAGETFNQQMIRRYKDHVDLKRLKYGPHIHRLTLVLSTIQKGQYPPELIASWRNLFWNHVDSEHLERDVTKLPEFATYANNELNLHGAEGRNFSFMEWYRHSLDFLGEVWQFGTPFVFGQWSWNWEDYKLRLLNWHEDIKQDSYMIKVQGGSGALSEEELLLSCLDRGLTRVDENLTTNELRKRLDEWMYLEDTKVEIPFLLAWAGGYHYDHLMDLSPFIESSHLWTENASKLPKSNPDLDPFLDMQVHFALSEVQERVVNTFREVWARSTNQERPELFEALAELVGEGAPEYVHKLNESIRKPLVQHVTANLLQRGNSAYKSEGAAQWTLPATAEFELRPHIFAKEARLMPQACDSTLYLSKKPAPDVDEWKWPVYLPQDPATAFEHPSLKLAWQNVRTHGKDAVNVAKVAQ
jgi:hypothetical protein